MARGAALGEDGNLYIDVTVAFRLSLYDLADALAKSTLNTDKDLSFREALSEIEYILSAYGADVIANWKDNYLDNETDTRSRWAKKLVLKLFAHKFPQQSVDQFKNNY